MIPLPPLYLPARAASLTSGFAETMNEVPERADHGLCPWTKRFVIMTAFIPESKEEIKMFMLSHVKPEEATGKVAEAYSVMPPQVITQ